MQEQKELEDERYNAAVEIANQEIAVVGAENKKRAKELKEINKRKNVDLVVVGSEKYLTQGIADSSQFPVFGPSKKASKIEGSKIFSKNFMELYQIPTPRFFIPSSKEQLLNYFNCSDTRDGKIRSPCQYVIKKDGLFAGKGVYLPSGMVELDRKSVV